MDPNETLRQIRKARADYAGATTQEGEISAAADLVLAVGDLDEWLSRGGFLPADWNKGVRLS